MMRLGHYYHKLSSNPLAHQTTLPRLIHHTDEHIFQRNQSDGGFERQPSLQEPGLDLRNLGTRLLQNSVQTGPKIETRQRSNFLSRSEAFWVGHTPFHQLPRLLIFDLARVPWATSSPPP